MPAEVFFVELAIASVGARPPGSSRRRTPSRNHRVSHRQSSLDGKPGVYWARGSGRRGPRSEPSDVSAFHVKDVIDMDIDELMQKYNHTLRAAGLLSYMLEADHGVIEEPEQKTWTLVRQSEFQVFQAWKRHKVWCFLRCLCDTRCLFTCPWRLSCLFCVFQTFRLLSLVLALGTQTVFTAFTMYSML